MAKRNLIMALCVVGLSVLLAACTSEAERDREAGRRVQAKTVVAPDGSIHLTPEQTTANRLQSATVIEQELTATITAIGRVTARAGGEADIFSPFAGRLVADPARLPRVGRVVRKGDVLAEVEQIFTASENVQFSATALQLETAIEQAQQEVQFRQTELDRIKQLYEGGVIPLKQLQTAEFNLKQAEARLDGARRTKAQYDAARSQQNSAPRRSPIRAPISGTVVAAELTAGQQIDPAKRLLTIVDLSRLWVEVAVHESNLTSVRRAERAEITTRADPERTYTGQLVTIGNLVDPANRTVPIIFAVNNSDGSLKIGMYAEAHIATGHGAKALLIPASAVLSEEGQSVVYVESPPGVYRRRVVTTGDRSGDRIVVTSGLSASEKVVSVGAQTLRSEALKGQIQTEPGEERR